MTNSKSIQLNLKHHKALDYIYRKKKIVKKGYLEQAIEEKLKREYPDVYKRFFEGEKNEKETEL